MYRSKGFGLLELMVVLVISSLLISIAVPAYRQFVQREKIAGAIGGISAIALEIGRFQHKNNNALPLTLNDLGIEIPLDPWEQAYEYLNIAAAEPGNGAFRKDGNLNLLNTDFDLYSVGRDGDSKGPLSAKASRDDIVRANNGAFIGLAENY
ncbi:MAG: prepilin-type N-terminal cleavage/methylation domain-containing protein [Proteobacteria bacterium]|nr:prepilin-type N-terminal cleavage/methylation domain-containing protein [Pseudomonadota bacterium]